MDRARTHHVYKYFEPADRFLRIVVAGFAGSQSPGEALGPEDPSHLTGAIYRRRIVENYVADLADLAEPAEPVEPGGTEERVEELYQLVLEVNPELDLRKVRLTDGVDLQGLAGTSDFGGTESGTARAAEPGVAREKAARADKTRFERRLQRLARDVPARLGTRVVGQERALATVARCVRRAALGWERSGPLGSMLLLGPTGTGKTELAKTLAQALGSERLLIRIDCTEYSEGHEYAKLLGSPPGYVGHEQAGYLSRELARAPRAVLLFDEVEKAHDQLHHLLLQLLDEGHVTDGHGTRLDFTDCFCVLTSNAGTRELAQASDSIGFGRRDMDRSAQMGIVRSALGERFRPEFLARLDEVVLFDELDDSALTRIATTGLTELARQARRRAGRVPSAGRSPKLRFTAAVAPWIARRGSASREGARGILQALRREVEAPLAELLFDPGVAGATWIDVSVRGDGLRFRPTTEERGKGNRATGVE